MTLVLAVKANPSVTTQGVAEVLARVNIFRRNAIAGSDGKATITIPGIEVSSLQRFLVYESFKVFCTSTEQSSITLYEDEILPENFVGGSDRGNLNEWQEEPPLYTTSSLIIQWTGADEGSNCTIRIQGKEVHLVPVRI